MSAAPCLKEGWLFGSNPLCLQCPWVEGAQAKIETTTCGKSHTWWDLFFLTFPVSYSRSPFSQERKSESPLSFRSGFPHDTESHCLDKLNGEWAHRRVLFFGSQPLYNHMHSIHNTGNALKNGPLWRWEDTQRFWEIIYNGVFKCRLGANFSNSICFVKQVWVILNCEL